MDIAGFAAEVNARPGEFAGQRIDIASDERTGTEAAAIVARASGHEMTYVEVPLEQVRAGSEDLATMFEWFNPVGYDADIAGLRARYPNVGLAHSRGLDSGAGLDAAVEVSRDNGLKQPADTELGDIGAQTTLGAIGRLAGVMPDRRGRYRLVRVPTYVGSQKSCNK